VPLQLGNRTAILDGIITVEDAEPLTAWLRANPAGKVNLRDCTHLHTAALQALLAAAARISVLPTDVFLRTSVAPALERLALRRRSPSSTSPPQLESA